MSTPSRPSILIIFSSFNPSISSTTILIPLVSLLSTTVFRINSISNGLPDTGIVVYSFRSPSTLLHNVCFIDLMPTAERITTDRETSSSGTKTGKSDGSVNIWDGSLVIFLIGITFCAVFVKTSVDVTSIPAASRVLTLTFKSNSSVISVCRVSIFKRWRSVAFISSYSPFSSIFNKVAYILCIPTAEKLLADTVTVELYSTTSISEGEVSSTVGGGYALSSE